MRSSEAADFVDPLYPCHKVETMHDCPTEASSSPLSTSSWHSQNEETFEETCLGESFPSLTTTTNEDDRVDYRPTRSLPFVPPPRRPVTAKSFSESFHQEVSDGELHKSRLRASLDAGMASITNWIRSKHTVDHDAHPREEEEDDKNSSNILPLELFDGDFDFNDGDAGREHRRARHRTQSEPDAARLRDHYYYSLAPTVRRRRGRAVTEELPCSMHSRDLTTFLPLNNTLPTEYHGPSTPGRSSMEMTSDVNNNNLNTMASPVQGETSGIQGSIDSSRTPGTPARVSNTSSSMHSTDPPDSSDPERRARMRWIRINRRFQLVITFVALLFSLLLFGVLVCWVVLTSSYVVSFDKSCDVPLKPYFWLVTLQLVLDVFRGDIMRVVFSWDGTSNQRIPVRVVAYNIAYLIYAVLVLRLGISSVFVDADDHTCRETAPELYNASAAFISLSIAAWATIICGYLLPFCVVAALLTYNGYNPSSSQLAQAGASQPVFPAAYSNTGAPNSCIEMLPIVPNELVTSGDYPRECCICMEDFRRTDIIVETSCKHVFHKQCCREWLLQARSCPICRTDIPSHLNVPVDDGSSTPNRPHNIPLGPTGRPVVGLLRILSHTDSMTSSSGVAPSPLRARTLSSTVQETNPDIEEGFRSR